MANQEVILKTIFQFKRGQSEAWERNNPILAAGEPGFELDTNLLKIGDGVTAYNDLEYFNGEYSFSADEKSLTINLNNEITIYGFNEAIDGQMPIKLNGKIFWQSPLSEADIKNICLGGENDVG